MKGIQLIIALLFVFTAAAQQEKDGDCRLDIKATTDSINNLLRKHSDFGHQLQVDQTGAARLQTRTDTFYFNFRLLASGSYPEGIDINGIERISCDTNAHAPSAQILFHSKKGGEAFIKLPCIDEAVLAELHRLLVCLHRQVDQTGAGG